jgi:hypothetical protein
MNDDKEKNPTLRPVLSDAEIARRREEDSKAVWSLRMEGLTPSPEFEDLFEGYITGALTGDEVLAGLHERIKKKVTTDEKVEDGSLT